MSDHNTIILADLKETVASAISALEVTDHSVRKFSDAYSAALDLQTLLSRPIKFAVGGEFSSGKSTFVKMLLGKHVVKTQASASSMPTVHFQYSSKAGFRAVGKNGSREISDPNSLSESELRELECLEVMTDIPFLERFEVFDTPGTSDPTRATDQLLNIANQVDFIIWCTNATQAWRASEKRMWENMPYELKQQSIMLVTHVDLPSVKPSLGRLMKRLEKEASSMFSKIISMDMPSATKARDAAGIVVDQAAWETSGGAECLAQMALGAGEIQSEVFDVVAHDLKTKISPIVKDIRSDASTFVEYWVRELQSVMSAHRGANDATVSLSYLKLLEGSLDFLAGISTTSDTDKAKLVSRLEEAKNYIGETLLKKQTLKNIEQNQNIITQLDWEFHHFSMLG